MSEGSIGDRIASLSRGELIGLAALLAVTLGGAALWYVRSLPSPVQVRTGPGAVEAAAAAPSPSPEPPVILVDVAGWVRRPGVYEFHDGDRVIDAIRAAGGARHGALLDALNLAAPLVDGTQVLVSRQGPGQAAGAVAVPATGSSSGLINVNTASASELEALPGIGEVLSQRIVDYRTEHGPFATVDDLLDVSGIGDATLGDIRDQVTV